MPAKKRTFIGRVTREARRKKLLRASETPEQRQARLDRCRRTSASLRAAETLRATRSSPTRSMKHRAARRYKQRKLDSDLKSTAQFTDSVTQYLLDRLQEKKKRIDEETQAVTEFDPFRLYLQQSFNCHHTYDYESLPDVIRGPPQESLQASEEPEKNATPGRCRQASEVQIRKDLLNFKPDRRRKKILCLSSEYTCWSSEGEFSSQFPEVSYSDAATQTEEIFDDHNYSVLHHGRKSLGIQVSIRHCSRQFNRCVLCPFRTKTRGILFRHALSHSGAKPFYCIRCQKKFHLPETLLCHLKKHAFRKPYKCHLCDINFQSKGRLALHIVRMCSETLILCFYCGSSFSTLSLYHKHLEKRFLKKLYRISGQFDDCCQGESNANSDQLLFNYRECFSVYRGSFPEVVTYGRVLNMNKS